jgi:hypothetical protein
MSKRNDSHAQRRIPFLSHATAAAAENETTPSVLCKRLTA